MLSNRVNRPEDLARPPRHATRRNPKLRTRGGKIAVLAEALQRPLLPHQQYIADVATELNPPGSRLKFRYQTVLISLPRQTGKTTLMRPIFLDRCLSGARRQTFMTAQSGKDASARWEDLVADYNQSAFVRSMMTLKRGKGDQRATFPNDAMIAPFTPDRDSLHGYSPDLVFVDEGWAFDAVAGADLMKAIRPAQSTRTERQLYIVSAAGDATSEWWNTLLQAAIASVDDPASRTAVFDWSMDPDADPYDRESWAFHPGLDGLITLDDLAEESKPENNEHADFLRGFMNIPTLTRSNSVIDLAAWDANATENQPKPDPNTVAYAYDVAVDRTDASVWAAWRDPAGTLNLHVLRHCEGIGWLAPFLDEFMRDTGTFMAADDGGPARMITDQLRRAGHQIETLNGRDYGTAWAAFKTAAPATVHDGNPDLRDALAVTVEKKIADQFGPSRHHSLGSIAPTIAAMVAAWYADRRTTPIQIF